MSIETPLKLGIYRHYKGRDYRVLACARDSETEAWHVVYRCLYADYSLWVRPLTSFTEAVNIDGEPVARFAWLKPAEPDSESLL